MNQIEKYEFDRSGYIVIKAMLDAAQVSTLRAAVDELEEHARAHLDLPPRKISPWFKTEYHRNEERGYHAWGSTGEGQTLMIEDFWNAGPAFHFLIDHEPTMEYINAVVQERPTINNSEIRIRYPGNATGCHMGGPIGHKYRYAFTNGHIDCMMVRMVYFIQDVTEAQGAFSVVPATHKSNYASPYNGNPDEEPGMIGIEVQAGDAILFTENLRHGGLTNRSRQTRKTIHVGYGPSWMMSQNIATADEPPYITEQTRSQLTVAQNNLLRAWAE
ncbi:MAG TPA: phytanoyl-CoA dioxygenase family protein [Abditibacteriaceae bacterium]|nr:phytanoyl-CoA dioxygenase family protein [Abditibacteriaceae bacterium]